MIPWSRSQQAHPAPPVRNGPERRYASPRRESPAIWTISSPPLSTLDHPAGLPDIPWAVGRLISALDNDENIGVSDHDVDGCNGHGVLLKALVGIFGVRPHRVYAYIGHRLQEGYGLSEGVLGRILATPQRSQPVITVDCGSSDEARKGIERRLVEDAVAEADTMIERGARGASSPPIRSPGYSRTTGSRSAWTARGVGWTTSSSSGCGAASSTRTCTCMPTRRPPSCERDRLARYFEFYNTRRRHSAPDRRTPDAVYYAQAGTESVA